MSRKAALLVALVVVGTIAFAATSLGSSERPVAGGPANVVLAFETTLNEHADANGNGALDAGETVALAGTSTANGKTVATWRNGCTVIDPETLTCTGSESFADGEIAHTGTLDLTAPGAVWAITGGTGRYRNVRGELKVQFTSAGAGNATYVLIGAGA